MTGRQWMYLVARLLGDVTAMRRGPNAMLRRAARKTVRRAIGRSLQRWGL